MKKLLLFFLFSAGFLLSNLLFLAPVFSQTNETLTISTYYPSPYGVYKELRLYPNTSPTACTDLTEGNMYYNSTLKQVMVCKWTGGFPLYDWRTIDSLWTLNATKLYPNNTTWNVGIGTASPTLISGRKGLNIVGGVSTKGSVRLETSVGGETTAEMFVDNEGLNFENENTNRDFLFFYSTKGSGGAELMRIKSSGDVGIGTPAPSTRLHIAGPSSGAIKIVDGNQAAGRVLTSDASGVGTWQAPGGGGMSNIRVYSTPGSSGFTVPAGVTRLWVEVYGGGGAGGGSTNNPYVAGGGGGGAGGVAMGFVAVTPGQSITVTVGAGGINGCSYSGGYGGASSFATLSATGGEGGSAGSQNYNWGGRGGQGSGGSINLKGGAGNYGIQFDTGSAGEWTNSIGSIGGSNAKGGGGGPGGADYNGGAFGGGGSGPSSSCCMSCYYGGYGGTGGVIIWY